VRIGVNLLLLHPGAGGVANYVLTLLRTWPERYPEDELVLFTFPANEELVASLPARARRHLLRIPYQREIARHLAAMDVFFCPFGSLFPRPLPLPSVVTLVDIQERFFPEFFSPKDIRNRLYHYDGSLHMADRVITISAFSRETLVHVVGLPAQKISVIHLCADQLPDPPVRPVLPEGFTTPFAFFPANLWPHKNHARLMLALARLKQSGTIVRCVLTGRTDGDLAALLQQRDALGLAEQVVHLGSVTRAELAWIYRSARLLVFPSLFEGFGIPVVEAMISGLPVVCSSTTSLPEVAGEAARYFDPLDPEDIAAKIAAVWNDEGLRTRLAEAGQARERLFQPERLVEQHRAACAAAIDAYRWRRYLWNKSVRAPWDALFRRRRIPAQQLARSRELLSRRANPGGQG